MVKRTHGEESGIEGVVLPQAIGVVFPHPETKAVSMVALASEGVMAYRLAARRAACNAKLIIPAGACRLWPASRSSIYGTLFRIIQS